MRFLLFAVFVLLVLGGLLAAGAWALLTATGALSASWWVRGLAIGLLVVGALSLPRLRGLFRHAVLPVSALIAAAGQIEEGDYSARVPERGPRDVRSLARAFNAMTERLETLDSQRRTFLADVAHELRTPLTVILGRIEAMLDGVDPRDDEQLERVLNQAQTLDRVVEDLRTAALAETGSLVLAREPTDLASLASETVRDLQPEAQSRGVVLLGEMGADVPSIDADPGRIRQVITNLLTNALRHTPSGGQIVVSVTCSESDVALEVADTGPGIPAELVDSLFQRFAKSSESPGVGLGLAIARDLTAAHGGEIELVAPDDAGARIRVTLPARSL